MGDVLEHVIDEEPDVSIAVFPFSRAPGDEAAWRLAARATKGVTRELVRLGQLRVVSYTSIVEAAARGLSVGEIARSLGADVLVEAGLAREGQPVRLEAVLVDAATQRKFWVDDFTGSASDLSRLHARVAAAASRAVATNASGAYWDRARHP